MEEKNQVGSTDPTVVLVAGKIGSGKSTALNNIFDLNLEAKSSPSSVTKVVHKETVHKNGKTFSVVDSPGLGGVTMSTKSVVEEMVAAVGESNFFLLYCLPVKPSDTLTETDKSNIMTINSHFGSQVWRKCVLLLTFSDIAKKHLNDSGEADGYIQYLEGHIQAFQRMLKSSGANISEIKLVFEVDWPEIDPLQGGEIDAVAMMNTKESEGVAVTPGSDCSCTEVAFEEIVKMSKLVKKESSSYPCGACSLFLLVAFIVVLIAVGVALVINFDRKEN